MLPDFPEVKKQLTQLLMLEFKDQMYNNSMAQSATKRIYIEGNKMGILRENGKFDVSEMKLMQIEITLSNEEMLKMTNEELQLLFSKKANEMANQINQSILDKVDQAIEETGNVISSPNGLTREWLHEVLKKMKVNFFEDDRNKHVPMDIQAGPEVIKKYFQYEESLTLQQKEKFDLEYERILDIKYKEHLADLANRKLIDE